ncbi:unnamed protein product [Chrysoparadoxa australica]
MCAARYQLREQPSAAHLPVSGSSLPIPEEIMVQGVTYKGITSLGSGAFGDVMLGERMKDQLKVALKFEKTSGGPPLLRQEYMAYSRLRGKPGFPKIYGFEQREGCDILVMEVLGKSLQDLQKQCFGRFSLETTVRLGKAAFTHMRSCHEVGLLHRDVKPGNFVMTGNTGASASLYCIDLGLAKQWRTKDGTHIKPNDKKSLVGTAEYASLNNHRGHECSRRDDLESVVYMLMHFMNGSLPWVGVQGVDGKAKNAKIYQLKRQEPAFICQSFPREFVTLLAYCRGLGFEEEPDYKHCLDLLDKLQARKGDKRKLLTWDWDRGTQHDTSFSDRSGSRMWVGRKSDSKRTAAHEPHVERAVSPPQEDRLRKMLEQEPHVERAVSPPQEDRLRTKLEQERKLARSPDVAQARVERSKATSREYGSEGDRHGRDATDAIEDMFSGMLAKFHSQSGGRRSSQLDLIEEQQKDGPQILSGAVSLYRGEDWSQRSTFDQGMFEPIGKGSPPTKRKTFSSKVRHICGKVLYFISCTKAKVGVIPVEERIVPSLRVPTSKTPRTDWKSGTKERKDDKVEGSVVYAEVLRYADLTAPMFGLIDAHYVSCSCSAYP